MSRLPLVMTALLLGCAPQGERTDSIPTPAPSAGELRGVVRVVGSAPMNVRIVLEPAEGGNIRLTGPLAAELERLAGAEVSVTGALSASPDPMVRGELHATDYQIVAVDGRPVLMGEIVSVAGGVVRLRTAAGEEVALDAAPSSFRVGQKVWVQGPSSVTVQSYGTIRP